MLLIVDIYIYRYTYYVIFHVVNYYQLYFYAYVYNTHTRVTKTIIQSISSNLPPIENVLTTRNPLTCDSIPSLLQSYPCQLLFRSYISSELYVGEWVLCLKWSKIQFGGHFVFNNHTCSYLPHPSCTA